MPYNFFANSFYTTKLCSTLFSRAKKFSVYFRRRPHQPVFFSENYSKWYFVWYRNLDRSFFPFVTIHAFDKRTNGRTAFSSLYRVCITCSSVKTIRHAYFWLQMSTGVRH